MIDSVDVAQRALQAPVNANFILFTGESASGKTDMLVRRYMWLLRRDPTTALASTIVTAANAASARALAVRIAERLDPLESEYFLAAPFVGRTLDALAFSILDDLALESRLALDLDRIEAWEAEAIFERAAEPLFSADWAEFLGPDVDPDISGLRAPDRFSAAVLRLIRKLRDAQITPDDFLAMSLRGAASFYASPPNFANPTLLYATKEEYRSSLAVNRFELERQRRREIDLAKIVAKLYASYLGEVVRHGCMTAGDAIAEATRLLTDEPSRVTAYRKRFLFAMLDDVHDLRGGELRLLQTIFGENLPRVTAAGDLRLATQTFAGARPEAAFALASTTVALITNHRVPEQILAVAAAMRDPVAPVAIPPGDAVRIARLPSRSAEATFVADAVAAALAAGTPAARIAVVHRSARCLDAYEEALIERNIPIALRGDLALLARRDVLDGLAIVWCAVDPYRHAWLMRVLQQPIVGLSDAALALLCGEPSNPQAALFELPAEPDTDRRWDRKRDLRLASNVVRGERDGDLDDDTRARLATFRARRSRWVDALRTVGVGAIRGVLDDAGMFALRSGETASRARRRRRLLDAAIALIERTAVRRGSSSVSDALDALAPVAALEAGPITIDRSADAVAVSAIDALETDRFEHVFIVDVRAGSFPPYYVPDAFLFSPQYGMIAKDNTGDARAARTAKFTWYQHKTNLRDAYAREHRRLLARAMTRADATVTISVHGKATRGVGAPEFVSELAAIRPALPQLQSAPPAAPVAFDGPSDVAIVTPAPVDAVMPLHAAVALIASITVSAARPPATILTPPSDRFTRVHVDLAVLLRSGDITIAGVVDAVVTDGDAYYAVAGGVHAAIEAAFVVQALDLVDATHFVRREPDGALSGPHPVDMRALIRFREALTELSSRSHRNGTP